MSSDPAATRNAVDAAGSEMSTVYREHEADVVVERKDVAADGVVTLTLRDPNGGELPAWTPGAHIDVILRDEVTRQYSLCGDPNDRDVYRVAVLREPESRGGSSHIHEGLQPGSVVRIRGPRNHFSLVTAPRYQFIAGGIGITPMLPMIAEAETRHADWRLLYGGRRRDSMAFVDELASYGDRVEIAPQDEVGLLDLAAVLETPREDTLVYCCGPEPLLAAVEEGCQAWPVGSLHIERFKARDVEPGADALDTFEVVLQRSGTTLTVPPDKSVLEVVEEAGVSVLSSCREGTCGTCETDLLEGAADHRDSILSPAEREANDVMMICVSRSCTPQLVLDL